ncbi:MAG: hypothetical protein JXR70_19575 [Spirochaetales bacterium]|nr:hypothetical protein [Spirochaetales bacterium]
MKHKVIFILSLLFLFTIMSCELNNNSIVTPIANDNTSATKAADIIQPPTEKLIKDIGTIRYIKNGEGFWAIIGKYNRYVPENLPKIFMRNGLKVEFTAIALAIPSNIRIWGRPVSLITMLSKDDRYPAVLDQATVNTVAIQGHPWLLEGITDTYQALNLPEEFMIPGLKVSVAGLIRSDIIIIPALWLLLDVKEITAISEMPRIISLGEKFKLPEGKQVIEPKARILFTFLEVLTDSRCPSNARCFWQGEALVAVNITIDGLDYGNYKLSTLAPNSSIQVGGYDFQFLDLAPYPTLPVEPVKQYTGVFVINPILKL